MIENIWLIKFLENSLGSYPRIEWIVVNIVVRLHYYRRCVFGDAIPKESIRNKYIRAPLDRESAIRIININDRRMTWVLSLRASMPEITYTPERCTDRKSERHGSDFQPLREAMRITNNDHYFCTDGKQNKTTHVYVRQKVAGVRVYVFRHYPWQKWL